MYGLVAFILLMNGVHGASEMVEVSRIGFFGIYYVIVWGLLTAVIWLM